MTKLKKVRESTGLSQSQFANKADISLRMLQSYEQGERSIDGAKIKTLLQIAKTAKCKLSDIIEDETLQLELREYNL